MALRQNQVIVRRDWQSEAVRLQGSVLSFLTNTLPMINNINLQYIKIPPTKPNTEFRQQK